MWSCSSAELDQLLGWLKGDHGGTCRLIFRWINELMKLSSIALRILCGGVHITSELHLCTASVLYLDVLAVL